MLNVIGSVNGSREFSVEIRDDKSLVAGFNGVELCADVRMPKMSVELIEENPGFMSRMMAKVARIAAKAALAVLKRTSVVLRTSNEPGRWAYSVDGKTVQSVSWDSATSECRLSGKALAGIIEGILEGSEMPCVEDMKALVEGHSSYQNLEVDGDSAPFTMFQIRDGVASVSSDGTNFEEFDPEDSPFAIPEKVIERLTRPGQPTKEEEEETLKAEEEELLRADEEARFEEEMLNKKF